MEPKWLPKSIISRKSKSKAVLNSVWIDEAKKASKNDDIQGCKSQFFDANGVQHAHNACALRPNIYRSAWPSAVCCADATCKPQDSVSGASWTPKMMPKMVPNEPQEAVQTRSTSIFIVLEVDSKTKPRKRRQPSRAGENEPPKLGLWGRIGWG